MVDAPAAVEVSEECEDALEASADSLSTQINEHDISLQQAEFGENWLIDEESAYYIDLVFDQTPEKEKSEESEHEDAKPSVSNEPPLIAESDASITLLRPSSFLQLSRTLFMNSSDQADLIEESVTSPAIFRGAFEDFHNLVISLTRRLVQVSLFQAMTRLRSGDSSRHDWTPSPQVREVDVRLALDVLGMTPNAHEYWAKVARRCKVDVLTESKKYMDGRQGSKTGVKLTYDEVEAELGLDKNQGEDTQAESDDGTIDSDMFTETDTDEDVEIAKDDSKPPRKRKRALSPSSYIKAEVKYLDAVDHNADVEEESRLWKMLRVDPPEHISLQEVKLPEHPGDGEPFADDWRDALQYEAEWEHRLGCVENDDFVEMEKRGVQGRMRRRKAVDQWRRRMDGESNERDDVNMESSEEDRPEDSGDDDRESGEEPSDHEMVDGNQDDSDD
ncbi:hypothetical protein PRZ48_004134 [Zasmidium cellare]|uniref:Uncharacterized protein n=1 Tax=Zasmidium cellare TaxID=395010 RepID=A0ABR0EX01_ZASCE|nr:hypothetical protein PRZ48_004134 [Zasmidium cellare]